MSDSRRSQPRIQKLIQGLRNRQARNWEVSILTLIVFTFGVLITFSDVFYNIIEKNVSSHPETIPVLMLVVLVWVVFQVTLLEREAEMEGQVPQVLDKIRHAHLQEWILSRDTLFRMVNEGGTYSQEWNSVSAAAPDLVNWILSAQPNVHLDILAFSTETFLPVCLEAVRGMAAQPKGKLEEVTIRVLVRDTSVDWLVPYLADSNSDRVYVKELKTRFLNQQNNWSGSILRELGRVLTIPQIHLDMRVYSFEPVFKGILINQEIGAVGIYPLGMTSWRGMQVWDYLGHEASMVRVSKSDGLPSERLLFTMFTTWFDDLWKHSHPWEAQ
ncbi:MAG: hypothetical protein JXM73_09860 [Anaerolineae bacterium]|nr:hypothetical protein [Anaerolineae bacterium]